jgi:hypothetical protein
LLDAFFGEKTASENCENVIEMLLFAARTHTEVYRNLNGPIELKGRKRLMCCSSGNAQELGGVCWCSGAVGKNAESALTAGSGQREKHPLSASHSSVCVCVCEREASALSFDQQKHSLTIGISLEPDKILNAILFINQGQCVYHVNNGPCALNRCLDAIACGSSREMLLVVKFELLAIKCSI